MTEGGRTEIETAIRHACAAGGCWALIREYPETKAGLTRFGDRQHALARAALDEMVRRELGRLPSLMRGEIARGHRPRPGTPQPRQATPSTAHPDE